jgi:hypothetical protein
METTLKNQLIRYWSSMDQSSCANLSKFMIANFTESAFVPATKSVFRSKWDHRSIAHALSFSKNVGPWSMPKRAINRKRREKPFLHARFSHLEESLPFDKQIVVT